MLTKATVANLDTSELPLLDAEDMPRPDVLARLAELTDGALAEQEPSEARELLDAIGTLVTSYESVLKQNQDASARYQKLMLRLRWKALATDPKEPARLVGTALLTSLREGIPVRERLARLLATTEFGTYVDAKRREELLSALRGNTERIGEKSIVSPQQSASEPSVGNWLKDFSKVLERDKNIERALRNYFSASTSVGALPPESKRLLQSVLELTTWLEYPQLTGEFISVKEAEAELKAERERTPKAPTAQAAVPVTPKPRVASVDEQMMRIMRTHNLRVDEAAAFKKELDRVFSGTTRPDGFIGALRQTLPGTPEEKLAALVRDTDREIFTPRREALMEETDRAAAAPSAEGVPTFEKQLDGLSGVKQRLEEEVHAPKIERTVEDISTPPSAYRASDPYREPIE